MLIQRKKFLQKYEKIPVFRVEHGKDSLTWTDTFHLQSHGLSCFSTANTKLNYVLFVFKNKTSYFA